MHTAGLTVPTNSSIEANSDRVRHVCAQILGVSPTTLSDESSPYTVGSWDSLNHLSLVLALQAEFGIDFSADDVLEMRSLAHIRTILRAQGVDV